MQLNPHYLPSQKSITSHRYPLIVNKLGFKHERSRKGESNTKIGLHHVSVQWTSAQNALNWNCGSFWLLILHSFGSVLRQLRVLGRHPSWNANCRKEKHHLLWSILACFECQKECYDVLWPWSLKTWHERSEALFDEAKQVLNLEICFSLAVKVFQLRTLYPAHHALRRITFGANHWADCYCLRVPGEYHQNPPETLDSRELGSRNKKAEMPVHLFMQIKPIIHCNNCFVARLDTEAERVLSFT